MENEYFYFSEDFTSEIYFNSVNIENIKELVLCPILPHFLKDPICCSKCECHFCRKCIENIANTEELPTREVKCPKCRNLMTLQNLKPPQKVILSLLDSVTLVCRNKHLGCNEITYLSSYLEHIANCSYELIFCEEYNCDKQILKKDYQGHKEICNEDIVNCEFCGNETKRKDIVQHMEQICAKRCKWCKQRIAY